jgi:hypothetical protein
MGPGKFQGLLYVTEPHYTVLLQSQWCLLGQHPGSYLDSGRPGRHYNIPRGRAGTTVHGDLGGTDPGCGRPGDVPKT